MGIVTLRAVPASGPAIRVVPMADGRLDSTDLFKSERTIRIVHGDQVYALTLTSKNKLILTK